MNRFEFKPHQKNDVEYVKEKFHFEQLAELVPYFETLIQEMKDYIKNIDNLLIVSDEVTARVPSLVLYKLMKKVNPNRNLNLAFVRAGHDIRENFENLKLYLQNQIETTQSENILFSTEYMFKGNTIGNFASLKNDLDNINIDVALLFYGIEDEFDDLKYGLSYDDINLFTGGKNLTRNKSDLDNLTADFPLQVVSEEVSGVTKRGREKGDLFVKSLKKELPQVGKKLSDKQLQEQSNFVRENTYMPLGERLDKLKVLNTRHEKENLEISVKDLENIQRNINDARADINVLVDHLYNLILK